MTTDKTPIEHAVEQALDAFVYAPIGLLFDGASLFPTLVEKGRNQVQVARMMGEFAVQMGQGEATRRVGKAQDQLRDVLTSVGMVPPPPEPGSAPQADHAEPAAAAAAAKTAGASPATVGSTPTPKAPPASAPDAVGIPDYDSLSASQVVSRLRGLGEDELEAVRAYESSTRARKTVLNKVAQLQKK